MFNTQLKTQRKTKLPIQFSVQGASLKLLQSHEQGVITRINALREATSQTLKKLGITLGKQISLEQKFPSFIVRVDNHCHTLDETTINAIYVRIVES